MSVRVIAVLGHELAADILLLSDSLQMSHVDTPTITTEVIDLIPLEKRTMKGLVHLPVL